LRGKGAKIGRWKWAASRSLLSRVLHGHQGISHMMVYGKLEKKLPEIIALRGKAYFNVEAIEGEKVAGLKETNL